MTGFTIELIMRIPHGVSCGFALMRFGYQSVKENSLYKHICAYIFPICIVYLDLKWTA